MFRAAITKYFIREADVYLSVCPQNDIMSGYLDHYVEKMIETVPPDGFNDVKKLISFAAAFAVFMPFDGIIAFTASLPEKQRKIFCLFDNECGNFVARSHYWIPKDFEKNKRLAAQIVSQSQKLDRISMVDCTESENPEEGIDGLLRKYLENEDSSHSAFFTSVTNSVLVKSKKNINSELFTKIVSGIVEHPGSFITKENLVKEYLFSFFCGCTTEKMNSMFSTISQDDIDYIFENDTEVSIECPRCGKTYKVKKDEIRKN